MPLYQKVQAFNRHKIITPYVGAVYFYSERRIDFIDYDLLAFTLHNASDAVESLWQRAREACGAGNRLFIHLWTIGTYHVFHDWKSLMNTIITGRPPPAS